MAGFVPIPRPSIPLMTPVAPDLGPGTVKATGSTTARTLAARFADVVNVKDYGAKGDGVTDDTAAIQAACDAAYAAGGGTVVVPPGHYKTIDAIRVKSGVALVGYGPASWIDNQSVSGFAKNTLVVGSLGDTAGLTSMRSETSYPVNAITAGATSVVLVNAGDAASFAVGDAVAIMSYETWATDAHITQRNDFNVVVAKNGATLSLRYAVPDSMSSASGNPTIARVTGTVLGYDGQPTWVAQNASVRNLRLTNAPGLSSSWYVLFLNGIGLDVENIWADNSGGIIGSNGLSHSTIRNVRGTFDMRGLDAADFQVANTLADVTLDRFALNPALPDGYGSGIYAGADVTLTRFRSNLGGKGQVSMSYVHRGVWDHPTILATGGGINVGLMTGYGEDVQVFSPHVDGAERHGIYILGERAKVLGGEVVNAGTGGAYNGVAIASGVVEWTVDGITLGVAGARTTKDRIVQTGGTSTSAVLVGNTTYDSATATAKVLDSTVASTNQAGPVTLKTYSISAAGLVARAWRIFASGSRSGTASTKTVNLLLGASNIGQVNYIAADTATWSISCVISHDAAVGNARVNSIAWKGTTPVYSSLQALNGALASDTTITLTGAVANSGDTLAVYQWIVEPLQ